jgi:hypothetical protein
LPLVYSTELRVQLSAGNACWETRLPAPASLNRGGRFFDRGR